MQTNETTHKIKIRPFLLGHNEAYGQGSYKKEWIKDMSKF